MRCTCSSKWPLYPCLATRRFTCSLYTRKMSNQIYHLTKNVKDLQKKLRQLETTVHELREVVGDVRSRLKFDHTTAVQLVSANTAKNYGKINSSAFSPLAASSPRSSSAAASAVRNGEAAAAAIRRARLSEALFVAIDDKNMEELSKLLAEGADVCYRHPELGYTALHRAVQLMDLDLILLFLDAGAPLEAKCDIGGTPLHWAASSGRVESIQALMGCGANINAKDVKGWTPLHVSALCGHAACARVLLDAGADKTIKSNCGNTPQECSEGRISYLFK